MMIKKDLLEKLKIYKCSPYVSLESGFSLHYEITFPVDRFQLIAQIEQLNDGETGYRIKEYPGGIFFEKEI